MTNEPTKDEPKNEEKYSDYPMTAITAPHPHDVLSGRGGGTNVHLGNTHWRMLVAANKALYVSLPKKQKQLLSKSIVTAVRSQDPPGRFLQKNASNNTWFDIGDQRAQEKTSQALREGAKEIRKTLVEKGELPPDDETYGVAERQQPEEISQAGEDTSESAGAPAEKPIAPFPGRPRFVETKSDEIMMQPRPDAPGSSDILRQQNHVHYNDIEAPPPPGDGTLEPPGLSFGSVSMGTSVLHDDGSLPMSRLESQGMSFGSTITVPTTLEPGGLSIGSAMSYNTTYTQGTARPVDGGLAEGQGVSIGSISMTSVEHERFRDSLEGQHQPAVLPPTLLNQQRSTANLLQDSDDEDDDLPEDGQPRREGVDYDMLQQRLAYAEATRQYSSSGSSAMWTAPASRQYSSGSSTQPLPLDRDISSASSVARFMGGMADAFADQVELERKTTSSTVEPTELLYGFSGFSLDSASGVAPPSLPDEAKQWHDLTDEEKLAMHLSRQESRGKPVAEAEPQHSQGV